MISHVKVRGGAGKVSECEKCRKFPTSPGYGSSRAHVCERTGFHGGRKVLLHVFLLLLSLAVEGPSVELSVVGGKCDSQASE